MTVIVQNAFLAQLGLAQTALEAQSMFQTASDDQRTITTEIAGQELKAIDTLSPSQWTSIAQRFRSTPLMIVDREKPVFRSLRDVPSYEKAPWVARAIQLQKYGMTNPIDIAQLEETLGIKIDLNPESKMNPLVQAKRLEIIARAAELQKQGVPNAVEVALLESKWKFKLNLDPEMIEAKAKELEKLFNRVKLPIPPSFESLPGHQQQALLKMGEAIRYLDVPYRLQSNTAGDVFERLVMQTPALAALRPYYLRFAGVYNHLKPNDQHRVSSFLPGMEHIQRYEGGGFYPNGMTLEEFHKHIPEGSALDKEMRVVFEWDDAGKLVAIPFSEKYKEWLLPAADLLDEAANLLDENAPSMAAYLRTSAKAFRDNDYPANDRAWVALNDPRLEADIGAVEQYADELRGYMAQFTGEIQLKNPEREAMLAALKQAFPQFEERLPVEEEYKRPMAERIAPPVDVVDNLFATADAVAGQGIAVAYNRPNAEDIRAKGVRIILMNNIFEARTKDAVGKKLTQLALDPSQRHLATSEAGVLAVFFHEEAHGNSTEYVVGHPDKPATQSLGPVGRSLEELKADIVGLHNAKTAFELGLISEELLHQIYVSYVRKDIGILRKGTAGAHARGTLVALNYLQEQGAIAIDPETGMTRVDLEKMPEVIAEFSKTLIHFKGNGDRKGAEAFYEKYGSKTPAGLDFIYKKMSALPIDTIVEYEFEELLN